MLKFKQELGDALSLSGTDTFYSDVLDCSHSSAGSFQVEWTGATPVVTETVWASNKPNPDLSDDSDWVDVTSTIAAVNVTGNSGKGMVDIPPAENLYDKYRLKFVNASGTATVTIYAAAKDSR